MTGTYMFLKLIVYIDNINLIIKCILCQHFLILEFL